MKLRNLLSATPNKRSWHLSDTSKFKEMYTFKTASGLRANSGCLFERIGNMLADQLKVEVEIIDLYLDLDKAIRVDENKKMLYTFKSIEEELLDQDHAQIAIKRAIGKVTIKNWSHTQLRPTIAINISEKGLEICIGENVNICSNFTILNPTDLISTYKKVLGAGGQPTKLNQKHLFQLLQQKIQGFEKQFEEDLKTVERLKARPITKKQWNQFLGKTFTKIEVINEAKVARRIKELQQKDYVVNSRQLAKIAIESSQPSYPVYNWNGEMTTKWNAVNFGTEILKFPNGSDSMTVLATNRDWVQCIDQYNFA